MKKIAGTRASASTQSYTSEAGQPSGNFVEPDETANPPVPGTVVTARWAQEVQSELTGTIEACGATLANGAQLPALLGLKQGVTGGRLGNLSRVQADSYSTTRAFPATLGEATRIFFKREILDRNSNATNTVDGFEYVAQRDQRISINATVSVGFNLIDTQEVFAKLYVKALNSDTTVYIDNSCMIHSIGTSLDTVGKRVFDCKLSGFLNLNEGDTVYLYAQLEAEKLIPEATPPIFFYWNQAAFYDTPGSGSGSGSKIIIEEMPEIL